MPSTRAALLLGLLVPVCCSRPGSVGRSGFLFPSEARVVDLTQPGEDGTVVDAPHSTDPDGDTVDLLSPGQLVAPLVVIDVRDAAAVDPDLAVTVEDLQRWEDRHGSIPAGSVVVMHSGWWSRRGQGDAYLNRDPEGRPHHPGFSVAALQFLVQQRSIRAIGVDTARADPGASDLEEVRRLLHRAGHYGIDHLTRLDRVPAAGAVVVVAPLKRPRADRAPARVLALISRR